MKVFLGDKKDELAVYHSVDEIFELVDYYLKNESARVKMAQKGRARVLKDHTYLKRAERIIEYAQSFFGLKSASAGSQAFQPVKEPLRGCDV
jgi:spore maturation protein CgeB